MIPILFFLTIFIPTYPYTQERQKDLVEMYREHLKTEQGTDFAKFIEWVER